MKAAAQRMPQIITVFVAVVFTGMYFATALPRISYPYDLDFLEDSVLMESLRVADGQSVYIPPNAGFNPHVYMPLFFWLGGMLFKFGGPSLKLLRSLSLAATLTTAIVIYRIAKHESGLGWVAVSCAGLFLAGYRISGFWYELARVDSLFVTLMLCGLALAIYADGSNRQLILSAFVLALTAFTKQTGFVVGAGLALYLFISIGWRALWFAIPFGGLIAVPLLTLNLLTHGWFFYHIFRIGTADPIEMRRLVHYLTDKIFGVMAGLSVMAVFAVWLGMRKSGFRLWFEQPWFTGIGLAVLVSGLGRIRVGGNSNNLMPVNALLCLAPALLARNGSGSSFTSFFWRRRRDWLLAVLILVQFVLGAYVPSHYIPTSHMRQSGDRLIQRIASIHGPVLVMMHPYYALLAGKEPSTQIATLWYVRDRGALPLPGDFVNRIQSQYYSAIISDESSFETEPRLYKLITAYYFPGEILNTSESPPTTAGVVVRPKVIYLPIQQ